MLHSAIPSSYPKVALHRSLATTLLTRTALSRPSLPPAVSRPHPAVRSFILWRRHSRRCRRPLEARFWGEHARSLLGDGHNRTTEPSIQTKDSRNDGSRAYIDGKRCTFETEHWKQRRTRLQEQYQRRMGIWKRMFEEDPYNAMFGASNAALKGKGWEHPFWNSIPKWLHEELEMVEPRMQAKTHGARPADRSSSITQTKETASNKTKDGDLEDLENPVRPIEVPRMRKSAEPELSSAYAYDPISGRMVAKETNEPKMKVSVYESSKSAAARDTRLNHTKSDVPQQVKTSHPALASKKQIHAKESTSLGTCQPDPRSDYCSKLRSLPKDDVDFLTLDELRSRIEYLRHRVNNLANEEPSNRSDMEYSFNQVHKVQGEEIIQKPNVANRTGFRNLTSASAGGSPVLQEKSSSNRPVIKESSRLSTMLERNEMQAKEMKEASHDWSAPKLDIKGIENTTRPVNNETSSDDSLARLAREILQREATFELRVSETLDRISESVSFNSNMDLSQLDDARARASDHLRNLQRILAKRARQLDTGHFDFRHMRITNGMAPRLSRLKNKDAFTAMESIEFSRRAAKKINQQLLRALNDIKARLSGRYEFANPQEMYPGPNPRNELYGGIESYDIQDMARLVTFQESPSKINTALPISVPSSDKFSPGFDQALADRLLEYENKTPSQPDVLRDNPVTSSREASTSSRIDSNADAGLKEALNRYEARTDPYQFRPESPHQIFAGEISSPAQEAAPQELASTVKPTSSELSSRRLQETQGTIQQVTKSAAQETSLNDLLPQYRIIVYDPDTKGVEVSDSTANTVDPCETTLYLPHAIQRLSNPAKFLPYIIADYEIISAEHNVLIMRKITSAKTSNTPDTTHSRTRVNPIDGTTCPLPEASSGSFASPTGYVAYHQPIITSPSPNADADETKRKLEGIEEHHQRPPETEKEGRNRERPKRGGFSRVIVAGITGATVCYVAGVAGELLK